MTSVVGMGEFLDERSAGFAYDCVHLCAMVGVADEQPDNIDQKGRGRNEIHLGSGSARQLAASRVSSA